MLSHRELLRLREALRDQIAANIERVAALEKIMIGVTDQEKGAKSAAAALRSSFLESARSSEALVGALADVTASVVE